VRIDAATTVKTRIEAIEPQNPMNDRSVRLSLPSQANSLAALKDCPEGLAGSDLLRDPVQTKRGLV
jgi:hypothetical protein